jgi:hypothetical protein
LSNTAILTVKCLDGTDYPFSTGLNFYFVKDFYTPYTLLKATFANESNLCFEPIKISLSVNGITIHEGIADSVDFRQKCGQKLISVTSKGFTSMLCQNQMTPGLITDISLNGLFANYYTIPGISHVSDNTQANYIYCKEGSSMWDAAENLCSKLYGRYPYIRGTNAVTFSAPSSPTLFTVPSDKEISCGQVYDYTKIVSHFHMQDINGTYNTYNSTNTPAVNRNIVRHKQIALDRQHLDNPDLSLVHKTKYSMRGYNGKYIEYSGYLGEDLCDTLSCSLFPPGESVSSIRIAGGRGEIITKTSVYYDSYCNL